MEMQVMPLYHVTDVHCVYSMAQHWPLWYTILDQISGWEPTTKS